jgi:hypothetical protein
MKALTLGLFLVVLVGCQGFGAGFRDGAMKSASEMSADALGDIIDKKLGDDFKKLSIAVKGIPEGLPKPPTDDPLKDTAGYTAGALVAYLLGSVAKGFVRSKTGSKTA